MRPSTIEIQIERVILVGPAMDEARVRRLRALIEETIRQRAETVRKPVQAFEGRAIRIDLPSLPPETPEWERRVADAAANAVLTALRGEPK
jgi:hypothetical protein